MKYFALCFIHLHKTTCRWICTKFGTGIGVTDIITCDKFFGDRLRDVDSVLVKICSFPLTRPVAINTGLALPRSPIYVTHIQQIKQNCPRSEYFSNATQELT